jgi:citrate synthase
MVRGEFPVVEGSEQAIDIKKLRDLTGIITLDPGYKIQVLVPVKLPS